MGTKLFSSYSLYSIPSKARKIETELRQGIREDIIFLLLIIWKKEEQIRLIVLSSFFSRALFRVKLLLGGNLSLSSFEKRSESKVGKNMWETDLWCHALFSYKYMIFF